MLISRMQDRLTVRLNDLRARVSPEDIQAWNASDVTHLFRALIEEQLFDVLDGWQEGEYLGPDAGVTAQANSKAVGMTQALELALQISHNLREVENAEEGESTVGSY